MSNRISIRNSNRYKAAIISLICALVFVGSAVIGIFAATQQNVSTNFSVVYSVGENVAVKVRTESYIPDLASNNLVVATKDASGKTITDTNGYVVFNAPDAYSEKEVVIPDVNLTPQYPTVEFLYTITNLNEQGYVQYDLIENLTTNTNIKTKAYYHAGDALDNTKSASTYVSTGWVESNLLNLPAGKTTAVKYVLSADDVNQYAEAEGTFGFNLIYTANETREAGTVNKSALIENTASTTAVVFDEYTSETEAAYTGVTLGTGTDISTEQNGTVNLYNVGDTTYVLSHEPIMLPEDSSYMFATDTTNVASVASMSVRPLATRTAKTRIVLNNVNTTMVKNMSNMFAGALVTELDLSCFNTIRVRNMNGMFSGCTSLTKIYVDDTWQTDTVTSSKDMFAGCTNIQNFNADVTDKTNANKDNGGYLSQISVGGTLSQEIWGNYKSELTEVYFDAYTSKTAAEYVVNGTNVIAGVTGIDISEEQDGSVKLYTVGTVGYVLSHTKIYFPENSNYLFGQMSSATIIKFNNVNTRKVTDMSEMFCECSNLISLDLTCFDTSNVTTMLGMFGFGTELLTLDISSFDTSKVIDMCYMFSDCYELINIYVGDGWVIGDETYGDCMFYACYSLPNYDYGYQEIDRAHYGEGGCLKYKSPNTIATESTMSRRMWMKNSSGFTEVYFDEYTSSSAEEYVVNGVNVISGVTGLDISEEQNGSIKLFTVGTKGYVLSHTEILFPFYSYQLFQEMSSLTTVNFQNVNTSNVIDMGYLFYGCSSLRSLDLSSFNTNNVTIMQYMFASCTSLISLNITGFNTSKVTNMESMFIKCKSLTSLGLSSFNTSNVLSMTYMFWDCTSLTSLDLSNFNTSNVLSMTYMFLNCTSLTSLNITGFNTSKLTDMTRMFDGCKNLTSLDLSSFNTSKVTTMYSMFSDCSNLTNIYVGDSWSTTNVTSSTNMFYNCTKLPNFNSSVRDKTNAHTGASGYLTYKAS